MEMVNLPTYDYVCSDCKHAFTLTMRVTERETHKVECPQCKSTSVRWQPKPFFAVTSKKS